MINTFGDKLRKLRTNEGLTQPDLAKIIGVEQSYLSRLENNKSIPSADIFANICQAFKLSTEELLTELDQQIIHRDFAHIPDIGKHLMQKPTLRMRYNQWVLPAYGLIMFGILVLFVGQQDILVLNTPYKYCVKKMYDLTIEERIKKRNNEINCSHETIDSNQYHGPHYVSKNDITDKRKMYLLYQLDNTIANSNKLLIIFGILFSISGLIIIVLEKRLRSVFPSRS